MRLANEPLGTLIKATCALDATSFDGMSATQATPGLLRLCHATSYSASPGYMHLHVEEEVTVTKRMTKGKFRSKSRCETTAKTTT